MRTDFSPTAEAARRCAAHVPVVRHPADRAPVPRTNPDQENAAGERWCEWPRRVPATRRVMGIWQTLQAIQARHA